MDVIDRMKQGEKISIGMVHTPALPGSFDYKGASMESIIEYCVKDAKTLEEAGFPAIIVANDNDGPMHPEGMNKLQFASLTIIVKKVREAVCCDVGVCCGGDFTAGIDIARAVGGVSMVRIPYYVDIRVSPYGLCFPNSNEVLWRRKEDGEDDIKILADIQIKHTVALKDGISIEESALWAIANRADCIIVTGVATGAETSTSDMARVKKVSSVPVIAGSGVSESNIVEQYATCDGAIIGSSLKKNKDRRHPMEKNLAERLIKAMKGEKE